VEDDDIRAQAARTLLETYFRHVAMGLRLHFACDEVIREVIDVDPN
jgi:hypothetical protein